MIYNMENFSFQILTIGHYFHQKGVFEVNARPFAALSFRLSGTGEFDIGSNHLVTQPGDVLFLPANVPYRVEYSTSESIVVHLDECNYSYAENIRCNNSSEIGLRFDTLLKTWKKHHSANQAKSVIYDILVKMENDQKAPIRGTPFESCVNYMNENFSDPTLDIKSVCDIGFISVSNLQRAFIRDFGISPWQYLIQLRMKCALELLVEKKLSIKEISYACGFADEKYFARAFKKLYGFSPSQFRNRVFV